MQKSPARSTPATAAPVVVPVDEDTIAALASAIGGAIAVIRLSGPAALSLAEQVWSGRMPLGQAPARTLELGAIAEADGAILDHCLAVRFPGPASYTGEDMVEFHCHGGVLGARQVLLRILHAGARHAEPGEFSRRAFLNGKMDLTQAEAVADLIDAHSHMALHLANRQLRGTLSRRLGDIHEPLMIVLSEVESRLDFPDEPLDWMPVAELLERLRAVDADMAELITSRREGEILRQGVRLVIAGPANVGKSSLLNAILGRDRAIVTELPGTTRDTLEELAHIRGIPVRLIDTAGIREAGDLVEQTGIVRSFDSMRSAQVLLWVFDASEPFIGQQPPADVAAASLIPVGNKVDKIDDTPDRKTGNPAESVYISALNGTGFELLFDAIEEAVWGRPHWEEPEAAVSARHATLLEQARRALGDATERLAEEAWELAAIGLHEAEQALGQVSGRHASADVLEAIFSRFCIGK